MESDYDIKYPKSRNNYQCLGPCYEKATYIIHPTTLEHVTELDNPFCPVNEWEYINPNTGKSELRITDGCFNPTTNEKTMSTKEIEMNIILPKIDFSCSHFLKIYYNIYSMETAMDWIDNNKHAPYYSVRRILDCTWSAYGLNDPDYVMDDRIIIYYIDLIKSKWMSDIYKKIGKYVKVDKNKIYFSNSNDDTDSIVKINFIIEKLVTHQYIHKFFTNFISYYSKNNDSLIVSYNKIIKRDLINYFEKIVEKMIN